MRERKGKREKERVPKAFLLLGETKGKTDAEKIKEDFFFSECV